MKQDKLIKDIESYMKTQSKMSKERSHLKGRKRFAVADYFANTTPGKIFSGSLWFTVAILAVVSLLGGVLMPTVVGVVGLLAGVAGFAGGFFLPKLFNKLNLSLKGKFGREYSKNALYKEAYYNYLYNLFCNKKVIQADNPSEIPAKDLKEFKESTRDFPRTYKRYLDEYIGKKIASRNDKDFAKIVKAFNSYDNDHLKTQEKINKILENNKKFVKPWCDLYNECGEYGVKFEEYARDFNEDMDAFNRSSYHADADYLQKKVDRYIKDNNYMMIDFDEHIYNIDDDCVMADFDKHSIMENGKNTKKENHSAQNKKTETKEDTLDLTK